MALSFKICTIEDLDTLVEISRNTFVVAFKKANNPHDFKDYMNAAFSEKSMKSQLLEPNSTFYFVYQDEDLVGYFKFNEKNAQNEQFEMLSVELERIYVLHEFQGQQIGKKILFKVIEIARFKQVSFLWLGVWDQNTSALRFYKRYGFEVFDSHPYYVGSDKQTDLLMKLNFA